MFLELSFDILRIQADHDSRYRGLSHLVSWSGAEKLAVDSGEVGEVGSWCNDDGVATGGSETVGAASPALVDERKRAETCARGQNRCQISSSAIPLPTPAHLCSGAVQARAMTGAPWLVSFDPRKRLEAFAGRESTGAHHARQALPLNMRPRLQRPADWSSAPLPSCPVTKYPSAAQALPLQSDRPPPPAPPPRPAPYQPDTLPHVNPGIELLSKSKFGNELGRTPSDAQSDVPSKSIAVSPLNSDDRERVGSNGYGAKTGGAITTAETTVRQPASARLNAVRGVADRGGVGIVEGRDARPSGAASAGSSVGAERGIAESQANELVTVPRASGVGEATEGGRKALPDQLQTIRPRAFRSLSSNYLVSLTG